MLESLTMKKITTALLFLLLLIIPAKAVLTGDHNSQDFLSKQIDDLNAKVVNIKTIQQSGGKSFKDVKKMYDLLKDSHASGQSTYKTIDSIQKNYTKMYGSLSNEGKKLFSSNIIKKNVSTYKKINNLLKSPKNSTSVSVPQDYSPSAYKGLKIGARQLKMYQSVKESKDALSDLQKTSGVLTDLNASLDKLKSDKISFYELRKLANIRNLQSDISNLQKLYTKKTNRAITSFTSSAVAIEYSGYRELRQLQNVSKQSIKNDLEKLAKEKLNSKSILGKKQDCSKISNSFKRSACEVKNKF